MRKVYLEFFVLDNMLMSFLIIQASNTLVRLPKRAWGVIVACVLSTLVSVLAMVNPFFLSLPVKLCLLAIMTLPFKIKKFPHFLRAALCVLLATNLFGGFAYALSGVFAGSFTKGVLYSSVSVRVILVAATISTVIPRVLSKLTVSKRASCYDICIRITTKFGIVTLDAKLDTGNQLRTTISDLPVIVVDGKAAKKALPKGWNDGNWTDNPIIGMSFVPFKTVSGRGMMPAMPAKVEYFKDKSWCLGLPCCIGISPHKLSTFGALVNAQWLD